MFMAGLCSNFKGIVHLKIQNSIIILLSFTYSNFIISNPDAIFHDRVFIFFFFFLLKQTKKVKDTIFKILLFNLCLLDVLKHTYVDQENQSFPWVPEHPKISKNPCVWSWVWRLTVGVQGGGGTLWYLGELHLHLFCLLFCQAWW